MGTAASKVTGLRPRLLERIRPRRFLSDAFDRAEDNFLLLRFIAAALVMFGHSYGFSGKPNHGDFIVRSHWGEGVYTGSIAVDMFFVISGFLVTGSYLNRANLESFLKSRALRILPAYVACIILTAFMLGAAFTGLPLVEYWQTPGIYQYIYTNLQFDTDMIYKLPGVFVHNFMPEVVNGSIWTLPVEVRMYGWVAILGALGILRGRRLANAVFILLVVLGLFAPDYLPLVPRQPWVRLAAFFLAGAFCFINRDWIPLSTVLLLALIVAAVGVHGTAAFPYALGLAIAYFCLWFAYVPNFHFFNRCGDYSYGLYLWAFPLQQAVSAAIGVPVRPWINFAVSLPVTLIVAMASWHWIEKPALRWKSRVATESVASTPAVEQGE